MERDEKGEEQESDLGEYLEWESEGFLGLLDIILAPRTRERKRGGRGGGIRRRRGRKKGERTLLFVRPPGVGEECQIRHN